MNDQHNQNGCSHSSDDLSAELLTAYSLGQLEGRERADLERRLNEAGQGESRQLVAETNRLAEALMAVSHSGLRESSPSPDLRAAVLAQLDKPGKAAEQAVVEPAQRRRLRAATWIVWAMVGGLVCIAAVIVLPPIQSARETARQMQTSSNVKRLRSAPVEESTFETQSQAEYAGESNFLTHSTESLATNAPGLPLPTAEPAPITVELQQFGQETAPVNNLKVTIGSLQGTGIEGRGLGSSQSPTDRDYGQFNQLYAIDGVADQPARPDITRLAVTPHIIIQEEEEAKLGIEIDDLYDNEQYAAISDNPFLSPLQQPLSTFSIDVDTASYANMRRFLTGGSLPPPDAVRIEELINYFRYDYPRPKDGEAFSVNMETAECPWNAGHLLLRVGLKGKDVQRAERPQSNLVFLLDVSGSMADEDKLPLLKTSMEMFTRELGENDRVSIVTYAGEAGLRLPPTRGHEQEKIVAAIQSLTSGGSTNGSAGIEIAYEQAAAYFVKGGTNRVILCTDGDLNVGITDDDALVELIKKKAAGGTFLTVLGFGQGNLKDAKMERLADNGNGLYAYIDSVREARKVLVEQMTGSTIAIAKDVKIQIEFNPAAIASYRLIGYENRVLAAKDFNDDTKDAGEIGAGHTVTALYELVPVGVEDAAAAPLPGTDPLKYQEVGSQKSEVRSQKSEKLTDAAKSGELLTLKLRYKEPDGNESKLLEHPLKERGGRFNAASKDLRFAASVASFGMILRGSEHRGNANLAAVAEIASGSLGDDAGGYRAEFVDLVRKAQSLGAK